MTEHDARILFCSFGASLFNNWHAHVHAFIADENSRPSDKRDHFGLMLSAERAIVLFFGHGLQLSVDRYAAEVGERSGRSDEFGTLTLALGEILIDTHVGHMGGTGLEVTVNYQGKKNVHIVPPIMAWVQQPAWPPTGFSFSDHGARALSRPTPSPCTQRGCGRLLPSMPLPAFPASALLGQAQIPQTAPIPAGLRQELP